jgi:Ala-tRNA(Pro) deacylase
MPDITPALFDGSPPADPGALLHRLDELGLEVTTISHPAVFTVEEARKHREGMSGAFTKNLFVRDKKGVMWLIVAIESQTVDLRAVAASLGHKRFSFGSPQRLMHYLGVIPGSVTPFGVFNDHGGHVRVALDEGLQAFDVWNFHPLVNSMTTTISAEHMLRFFDAVDHPPTWVSLG